MEELFKNLTEALRRFGPLLIREYQNQLAQSNHNASGRLSSSLEYEVAWKGGLLELSLSLEDYWKYVEEGRRPGKFPPPQKILEWIRVKHIAPRPYNGKLPTEQQLAFLIGRKIAREGIKGTNDLNKAEESNWDKLLDIIDEAIEKDINESLDEMLELLWK